MSLNVNRGVTDPFYRYKMPRLSAKVEGKGNGIKTVIVNMSDVAKGIGCPPTYPCKFFGCELGAQTQFNFKDDRYVVNGSHTAEKLQQLLDVYIKKFILCKKCDNPETILTPNEKKQTIRQNCVACGHEAMLDMRHKLTTFILKNPPGVKLDQQGKSMTKKKDRTTKSNDAKDSGDKMDSAGTDDDWDDDEVDLSDAAVMKRMEELSGGVKHLTLSNLAAKTVPEKLEIFYMYCKEKKDASVLHPGAVRKVFTDISAEADSLELKQSKAVMALVELLFDAAAVVQVSQYRILLLYFTHENPKAQRYLLGAFEKLIELHQDTLLPKAAHLFKELYDRDVLDEEVILEWAEKPSKKYVSKTLSQEIHAKVSPFIKWLKEAEEEESEEEEDEEEAVEIGFAADARSASLKEQESGPEVKKIAVAEVANGKQEDSDDSDVDIDDI